MNTQILRSIDLISVPVTLRFYTIAPLSKSHSYLMDSKTEPVTKEAAANLLQSLTIIQSSHFNQLYKINEQLTLT